MKHFCRSSVLIPFALLLAIGAGSAIGASSFPEKPITVVVAYSAGGGSDIFARMLASSVEKDKLLPKPLIVENKPGGSGGIGYGYVAGKKKDPYFLVTVTPSFLTTPLISATPFGLKDFTPIANFAFDEFTLIVNAASKYKSMQEVVADAKANPKKITMGGTALGGADSVAYYLIEKAAGIQFNYIVFNGGGEVNAALLGGHIDMAVSNPGESLELYKAGKIRILGVFSEKRLAGAPDIPTLKEQGVNVVYVQNRGIVAPADIPADAHKTLEQAFYKYTQTDTFKKYCKDNMLTEAWMDGAAFGKFLEDWNGRYAIILRDMGLLKKK
jgi:putative tricarboxylic transport membrane protein